MEALPSFDGGCLSTTRVAGGMVGAIDVGIVQLHKASEEAAKTTGGVSKMCERLVNDNMMT